jgi:ATP-dependent helicase HrpB
LRELFPDDMGLDVEVRWGVDAKRVVAEEVERFRDLSIERRRVEPPPLDEAARLLAEEVLAGRLKLDQWTAAVDQWVLRVNLIARTCPELGVAAIGQEDLRTLVEHLCHGAVSYREIKDRAVLQEVRSWLDPARQDLVDRHAPERVVFPGGRKGKVAYVAEGPPYVAMRIQELFGVTQVPRIAMGRVALLVHILAPNHRPVQVTQDLAGFWREHYPRVKRELQRRYPKHEWRDVP